MTAHTIRYLIDPSSACPVVLLSASGHAGESCDFDTDDVSLVAFGEILQTAPRTNPFAGVFDELLASGQKLVWKGEGPGRGVEMRRAFSGIFGRFFARAYLQRYHGFTWFAPISGDPTYFSRRWRATRGPGERVDLPDWLCAGPGRLAIAEAKGSHQKNNATHGGHPGPIRTAEKQIQGVRLQKKNGGHWIN